MLFLLKLTLLLAEIGDRYKIMEPQFSKRKQITVVLRCFVVVVVGSFFFFVVDDVVVVLLFKLTLLRTLVQL